MGERNLLTRWRILHLNHVQKVLFQEKKRFTMYIVNYSSKPCSEVSILRKEEIYYPGDGFFISSHMEICIVKLLPVENEFVH